jgi:hypothetical protein
LLPFLVIIAALNMLLGFGLAIYLGHARTIEVNIPWLEGTRFGLFLATIGSIADANREQTVSMLSSKEEGLQGRTTQPSASPGQHAPSNAACAATEDGIVAADSALAGPVGPGPVSAQPMSADPIADPDSQPPSEEELLAGITAIRSEMAEAISEKAPEAELVTS